MPVFRLPHASAYLVALSGGADSRLLLELSVRAVLEREPGAAVGKRILAAHLHHGIRGGEADRDEAFCRQICAELGIPLLVEHADIPAMAAASGESLETVARRARYDFFLRMMRSHSIPVLLTAHHADDNLETVLDRLLRGSGTRGMGGIPPSRVLGAAQDGSELTVIRPLLEWTKRDILAACGEMGLDYVTDSTNLETAYTRNRLRHTVTPALEELAGEGIPQRAAARLSRAAREDDACLTALAEAQVKADRSPTGDGLLLERLQSHHPAIAKRMMAILYEGVTAEADPPDGRGLSTAGIPAAGIPAAGTLAASTLAAVHLDALYELIQKGVPEASLSLPRGMEARVRGDWLCIRPAEAFDDPLPPAEPVSLSEGYTQWGRDVTVLIESSPEPLPQKEDSSAWASAVFPADLPLPLIARARKAGDTILSHGMTKKLKKLLCDKGIPLHLRERIPLLCLSGGEALWYPGAAFRDGFPAPKEGPCLRITVWLAEPIQGSPRKLNRP